MNLVAERISVDDYGAAIELIYARNWTDGLPVVLPTRRRVEAVVLAAIEATLTREGP
jgi:hypothetical protein